MTTEMTRLARHFRLVGVPWQPERVDPCLSHGMRPWDEIGARVFTHLLGCALSSSRLPVGLTSEEVFAELARRTRDTSFNARAAATEEALLDREQLAATWAFRAGECRGLRFVSAAVKFTTPPRVIT